MVPPHKIGSARTDRHIAAAAVRKGVVVSFVAMVAFVLPGTAGCATFGRRHKTAEEISAARELSRQGVSALEANQNQRAEELLRQALAASPNDAATHRYMAEALWRRSARKDALSQIDEAIELEPNNATLAVRAGEMSLASGIFDVALSHAERAIRLDPKSASAWALRGRCFEKLKQPDRALADLQRAAELEPESSDVLLDIASLYRQRGQNTRCLAAIHHLLDTYPQGEEPQQALVIEGLTLTDLGRPQQATEAFLAAVRRGPPSADVYFYLAQAYSAAGQFSEATTAAQQALAVNATHEPSRQLLAQMASHSSPGVPQRR